MADSNAVRFLEANGIDLELALEMFWGEVFDTFQPTTVLWNTVNPPEAGTEGEQFAPQIVQSQTIQSGKSWQFILTADDVDPETHTPGTELLGQDYAFDEGSVTIDGILVMHKDVPIDQLQHAHYDPILALARNHGRKLARNFDRRGFSIAAKAALGAARTKNGLTVHNGGNTVERIGADLAGAYPVSATGAKNFRDDVDQLAQLMDEDDVPEEGRYLIYDPYIRRVLQQDLTVFDARYNPPAGNDFASRRIGMMGSFTVLRPSNHIPSTNLTASSLGGNLPAKYQQDWTYDGGDDGRPAAIALCGGDEGQAALGYVAASMNELSPIYSTMIVDERRNTIFIKSQMMVGWDQLYTPCAGMIYVDDA
jgi:hypothetical protein